MEDQKEFVEYLQIGKEIGKFLDMPTRHRAQKHTYLNQEYEKSGNQVPNLSDFEQILKMLTKIMCRMAVTLFQTS